MAVMDDMDEFFEMFKQFNSEERQIIREKYTFGYFCTREYIKEDSKDNYKSYQQYIFSNQFFTDLLEFA